ncbi:hypothetical protein O5D80_003177 [Batrachochytrium dendrobatidis]|nr:hypothetical protein O5D80_003177 [Batrachochytrium dendrobatidis]
MKFSIAVLSSILAICSVTIANPVDPNSTISTEVSTSTASTSATSADGPNYSSSPSSYNGFEKHCHSFNPDEIVFIEKAATIKADTQKIYRKHSNKNDELVAQKKVVDEMKQQLEILRQTLGQESAITKLEAELVVQNSIFDKIQDESSALFVRYTKETKKANKSARVPRKKTQRLSLLGSSKGDVKLETLTQNPAFFKCYEFFLDRLLQ